VIKTENLPSEVVAYIAEKDFQIFNLQHELAQLKRMIFGARSERCITADPSQLKLEIATEEIKPVEE